MIAAASMAAIVFLKAPASATTEAAATAQPPAPASAAPGPSVPNAAVNAPPASPAPAAIQAPKAAAVPQATAPDEKSGAGKPAEAAPSPAVTPEKAALPGPVSPSAPAGDAKPGEQKPDAKGEPGKVAPPARSRAQHAALVAEGAKKHGVPLPLADAVARVESGYDPTAVSNKGAVGLMQVMPNTARQLGFSGTPADLFTPETNVHYGMTYLGQAWKMTGGSVCRTVLKYYAGHGAERMIPDAMLYCRRVVAMLDQAKFPVPQADRDLINGAGGPIVNARVFPTRGRPVAYALRSAQLRRLLPAWLTNPKLSNEQVRAAMPSQGYKTLPDIRIMVGN